MNNLSVAAGVFRRDNSVLLMRRGSAQPLAGRWEYPGGKIECGESPEQCLRRELYEELAVRIVACRFLTCVTYCMDSGKNLNLYLFDITKYIGDIKLSVHDKMVWVNMADLVTHPQLPADLIASRYIVRHLGR